MKSVSYIFLLSFSVLLFASVTDESNEIGISKSGNIYVTGFSGSNLIMFKCNSSGNMEWIARYLEGFESRGTHLLFDAEENIYIIGSIKSLDQYSPRKILLIKYNNHGKVLWVFKYDGPNENGNVVSTSACIHNGFLYLTGRTQRGSPGYYDILVLKFTLNGVLQWEQFYDGPGHWHDSGNSIICDDGNVYVSGYQWGLSTAKDFITLKYDNLGTIIWARSYDGPVHQDDISSSLIKDDAGNIYVMGTSVVNYWYSSGYYECVKDITLIKYSSSGDSLWQLFYDGGYNLDDTPSNISLDTSNNLVVSGTSYKPMLPAWDIVPREFVTMKISPQGSILWYQKYGDYAYVIDSAIDAYGNIVSYGSEHIGDMSFDLLTVQYSSAGVMNWWRLFNSRDPMTSSDKPSKMSTDTLGNIILTGSAYTYRQNSPTGRDIVVIKYNKFGEKQWDLFLDYYDYPIDSLYSISSNSVFEEGNIYLYANYPNPFNEFTTIQYFLSREGRIILKIFNSIGEEIEVLIDSEHETGLFTSSWYPENIASGVYFLRLEYYSENIKELSSRKILFLK